MIRRTRVCAPLVGLCVLFVSACNPGSGAVAVDLSWRFVDDRPCDLAGVVDIHVFGSSQYPTRFRCVDGFHPAVVSYSIPDETTSIVAEARSVTGAVLYRGEGNLVEGRRELRLSLRFVGGAGSPP